MTIEDLKNELLGKTYTLPIKLRQGETVTEDVEKFLRVQFISAELWEKDLQKCPAYLRLVSFYEATR